MSDDTRLQGKDDEAALLDNLDLTLADLDLPTMPPSGHHALMSPLAEAAHGTPDPVWGTSQQPG